jgi:hypothetical protein
MLLLVLVLFMKWWSENLLNLEIFQSTRAAAAPAINKVETRNSKKMNNKNATNLMQRYLWMIKSR